MGWAIEASSDDALLRSREKYLVALEQVLAQGRTARMGLAQQLSQDPEALVEVFDLWQSWWRDLLLVRGGNPDGLTNVDREQSVLSEARRYALDEIVSCLRALQDAAQQVEQNVNACLALEVLFLKLPRQTNGETLPRQANGETLPRQANGETLPRRAQGKIRAI